MNVLTHPEAAQLVDALVAAQGGLVAYGLGAPGREVAVAAGARLAADSGVSLTVVDYRHLLAQIRSTVDELYPRLACAVISADQAAQHRPRIDGVLVVHADLLRAPGVGEALVAMARTAENLIVAGREDFDASVLEDRALARFVFQPGDLTAPVPHGPARRPGMTERHDTARAAQVRDTAASWAAAPAEEREQRLLRQSSPQAMSEQDTVSRAQLADLIQTRDPDELLRRIEEIRDRHRQRAADHRAPVLGPGRPVAHDRGQEQAAAHQQHRPQGPSRT